MSANVWGGDGAKLSVASMDADQVASLLGGELGATSVIRTNASIASPQRRGKAKLKIPTEAVALALVGIGALAGGHRLRHYEQSEELQGVKSLLKELCDQADVLDPRPSGEGGVSHHWVADLCNHLFIATSGPHDWKKEVRRANRKELEWTVNKLNSQFLSPRPQDFVNICRRGSVVAVAGGRHKVAAVYHVLRQRPPWITHLVTDNYVGRSILENVTGVGL